MAYHSIFGMKSENIFFLMVDLSEENMHKCRIVRPGRRMRCTNGIFACGTTHRFKCHPLKLLCRSTEIWDMQCSSETNILNTRFSIFLVQLKQSKKGNVKLIFPLLRVLLSNEYENVIRYCRAAAGGEQISSEPMGSHSF